MSIWSSLDLPEPIRDIGGADIDVAVTTMHPEHPAAVRVCLILADDGPLYLSPAAAERLRGALDVAVRRLSPSGEPVAVDRR